jgi:hypothetical protein
MLQGMAQIPSEMGSSSMACLLGLSHYTLLRAARHRTTVIYGCGDFPCLRLAHNCHPLHRLVCFVFAIPHPHRPMLDGGDAEDER